MNRAAPFDLDAWLRQWRAWLEPVTDRLFDLDERTKTGSAGEQSDVAAAFVARKAIADRLDAVAATMGHDRAAAKALANRPLVDGGGAPVGDDLDDAARLLEAIVGRLEQQVAEREHRQQQDAAVRAALNTDLAIADRLSAELGERVNQVAELRRAADAGRDLAATGAAAARVRADLERASEERDRLLARWRDLDGELGGLGEEEGAIRQLAARCREKIAAAPPVAVPSVAVVAAAAHAVDVAALPWPAVRAKTAPIVEQVDRLKAALAEARRRFQEPLDRRDDLRGLLQSFRQKAAAKGFGEHPDVDRRYRAAEQVLWSAPCDLAVAGPLVDEFVAFVNSLTTGVPR